ncbi:hypothetical protein B0H16DRAFT_1605641 [Mycena metata]|uniref:Uncharacterized protein n=1 Tax=Mycena metata TaxID=1033252 RepID=A0AAD7HH98_9AGAR|nr:hypothetical protein B0H16DRAFT_1605641 [Mycena metata]
MMVHKGYSKLFWCVSCIIRALLCVQDTLDILLHPFNAIIQISSTNHSNHFRRFQVCNTDNRGVLHAPSSWLLCPARAALAIGPLPTANCAMPWAGGRSGNPSPLPAPHPEAAPPPFLGNPPDPHAHTPREPVVQRSGRRRRRSACYAIPFCVRPGCRARPSHSYIPSTSPRCARCLRANQWRGGTSSGPPGGQTPAHSTPGPRRGQPVGPYALGRGLSTVPPYAFSRPWLPRVVSPVNRRFDPVRAWPGMTP